MKYFSEFEKRESRSRAERGSQIHSLGFFSASPIFHPLPPKLNFLVFGFSLADFQPYIWWGVISSWVKLVPGQQCEELPTFTFWKVSPTSHERTLHISNIKSIRGKCFKTCWHNVNDGQWVMPLIYIAPMIQAPGERPRCKDSDLGRFGCCQASEIVLWRC